MVTRISKCKFLRNLFYFRFECNTWHLEPTVRLWNSWAGSEIEPYGVDYILQRLGFSHARTTIPKWLQRGKPNLCWRPWGFCRTLKVLIICYFPAGCMDPLDKVLSVIVLRTIQVVQEEKSVAVNKASSSSSKTNQNEDETNRSSSVNVIPSRDLFPLRPQSSSNNSQLSSNNQSQSSSVTFQQYQEKKRRSQR